MRLLCFFIGHKMEPTFWYSTGVGDDMPPGQKAPRWYRYFNCARCGEHMHTQFVYSKNKPLEIF